MEFWKVAVTKPRDGGTLSQTIEFFENHSNALRKFNEELPRDHTLQDIQDEARGDEFNNYETVEAVTYKGLTVKVVVVPGNTVEISPIVTQEEKYTMIQDPVFQRFVSYSNNGPTEYASYSVLEHQENDGKGLHFAIRGVGVNNELSADTLGELLEKAKSGVSVSEGRRSKDEIDSGSKMTSRHHEKLVSSIEDEIEEYSAETTAEEWLEQVK